MTRRSIDQPLDRPSGDSEAIAVAQYRQFILATLKRHGGFMLESELDRAITTYFERGCGRLDKELDDKNCSRWRHYVASAKSALDRTEIAIRFTQRTRVLTKAGMIAECIKRHRNFSNDDVRGELLKRQCHVSLNYISQIRRKIERNETVKRCNIEKGTYRVLMDDKGENTPLWAKRRDAWSSIFCGSETQRRKPSYPKRPQPKRRDLDIVENADGTVRDGLS